MILVQMQSGWDRFETGVVLGESSTLMVAIILINNAD